jgi:hypothetical protein
MMISSDYTQVCQGFNVFFRENDNLLQGISVFFVETAFSDSANVMQLS